MPGTQSREAPGEIYISVNHVKKESKHKLASVTTKMANDPLNGAAEIIEVSFMFGMCFMCFILRLM